MDAADRRSARYREQVLDAAEQEFARCGYHDAKIGDITERAGLSLHTVYKHFAGKEAVWDAVHERRVAEIIDAVRARSAGEPSALEQVILSIAAVAEYLAANDAYLELNLRTASAWLSPEGTQGSQRHLWTAGAAMVRRGIDTAKAEGALAHLPAGVASGLVLSALQVWLSDWVANGRDRTASAVVEDLARHLRRVLERPPATTLSVTTPPGGDTR